MTTQPGDQTVGTGGRGHLRVSHADREHVIGVLKAAYVAGMLDKDEFDLRVAEALASRTCAELAALTADIPAGVAAAEPAAEPAGTPARTLAKAARRSGTCMLVAFALVGVVALTNAENLVGPAFVFGIVAVIAASGFLGYGVVDAWQERRARAQLPPGPVPGPGGAAWQRRVSAYPGSQLRQTGHGHQHAAETAPSRRRTLLPVWP